MAYEAHSLFCRYNKNIINTLKRFKILNISDLRWSTFISALRLKHKKKILSIILT
jgi:hypothetical protein